VLQHPRLRGQHLEQPFFSGLGFAQSCIRDSKRILSGTKFGLQNL
jgi:hypothetical protein